MAAAEFRARWQEGSSTRGQARAANGGSKLPHSTGAEADGVAMPLRKKSGRWPFARAALAIEERFLACASRRFAQNQKRGPLRSE